jgi:hypothetical protein
LEANIGLQIQKAHLHLSSFSLRVKLEADKLLIDKKKGKIEVASNRRERNATYL